MSDFASRCYEFGWEPVPQKPGLYVKRKDFVRKEPTPRFKAILDEFTAKLNRIEQEHEAKKLKF